MDLPLLLLGSTITYQEQGKVELVMCGRFTLFADYGQILERFHVVIAFVEDSRRKRQSTNAN